MGFGSFLRDKVAPVVRDLSERRIPGYGIKPEDETPIYKQAREWGGKELFQNRGIQSSIESAATEAIEDTGVTAPTLSASEVDPEGKFGALQDIRKEKRGRTAANLAPASGASILTS